MPVKKRKLILNAIYFFIIILLLYIILMILSGIFLKPVISAVGIAKAQSLSIKAISAAINDEMKANGEYYKDLVIIHKNENGEINALSSDVVKINVLNANISEKVLEKFAESANEIKIPLGNFINGELFMGRGPMIKFRLAHYDTVSTNIESSFTAAGINQTRHRTFLRVKTKVSILLSGASVSAEVNTAVCISENVIVGKVPENFTEVNEFEGNGLNGLINDYKAVPNAER